MWFVTPLAVSGIILIQQYLFQGYGDGGALTQPLKENPKAIVLLDEIEKAHPDVLTLFLQVFDDGRITDSEVTSLILIYVPRCY